MKIRRYVQSDLQQMIDLFFETVHSINRQDYSISQVNAWANPEERANMFLKWSRSLNQNYSYVAEKDKEIVGFIDMTSEGLLNRLYVHRDYQRQKIATQLLEKIEMIARAHELTEITTEASITARPFFERRNFLVTTSQLVEKNGVQMKNYKMVKKLG